MPAAPVPSALAAVGSGTHYRAVERLLRAEGWRPRGEGDWAFAHASPDGRGGAEVVVASHVPVGHGGHGVAGPAHAGLAGERHLRARRLCRAAVGVALRPRGGGLAPVEYERDLAGGGLDNLGREDVLRRGF